MGAAMSKVKTRPVDDSPPPKQLPKPIFPPTDNKVMTIDGREFNTSVPNEYILPRDGHEVDRLSTQYFAFKKIYDDEIIFSIPRTLLESGKQLKILDIGCGPGNWSLEMAMLYPNARIYGIDISDNFPTRVMPPNVSFQIGSALEKFPFEDEYFDICNIRFLAVAIKRREWPKVLSEIIRVLVPGGYFNTLECDFTFKGNEYINEYSDKWHNAFLSHDIDSRLASKFGNFMTDAGFEIVETNHKDYDLGGDDELNNTIIWDLISAYRAAAILQWKKIGFETLEQCQEHINVYISETRNCHIPWQFFGYVGQKPKN